MRIRFVGRHKGMVVAPALCLLGLLAALATAPATHAAPGVNPCLKPGNLVYNCNFASLDGWGRFVVAGTPDFRLAPSETCNGPGCEVPSLWLISDGQPTDSFEKGLTELMDQPWGTKAVRIAIAIGADAEHDVLQKFIGHPEFKPLQANNAETLVRYIRWASTEVLKSASSPASQTLDVAPTANVPPASSCSLSVASSSR